MAIVFIEAFGAGALLVLIVWWTMFSGRVKGELPGKEAAEKKTPANPEP